MVIVGLEDFGIGEAELATTYAERKFGIAIRIPYFPDMERLQPLTPKERRLLICQYFRDQIKIVKANYPTKDYELFGSTVKPRGLDGQLTGKQLAQLRDNSAIERVVIQQVEGHGERPKKENTVQTYFSVQALFAAEVEGLDYTNTVQVTDERILLIKAFDEQDATEKAMLEFKEYEKSEYLNNDYRFVKWKFIEIWDVYASGISELDPDGTEVFSVVRNRKIKKH